MLHSLKQALRKGAHDFITCGVLGWCLEVLFTALGSLRRREFRLTGTTSVWMFPIYGAAAFLTPVFRAMHRRPLWLRGLTYTALIFSAEYASGRFLRRYRLCPWDYSRSRFHVGKVIRLDYAPNWFGAGLLFERVLTGPRKPTAP